MKVIAWNIQGAKKSKFQQGVINRTMKPNILILIETMFNKRNTECIIKTLGYHNHDTILSHNHTRGI